VVIWTIRSKTDEFAIKGKIIGWLSIVFALLGIMFAVTDSYLAQYDYKPRTIYKYESYKEKGVKFDALVKEKTNFAPEYIFAFDVSKSTKKTVYLSQNEADSIDFQIKALNETGLLDIKTRNFGFDKKNKTISYFGLLKVRLLCSLAQLDSLNYNDLNYSIIYFADQIYSPPFPSERSLKLRLSDSFKTIDTIQTRGDNSNFNCLLNHINKHFLYDNMHHVQNDPYRSNFERKNFIIVFLTDFLHDVKDEKPSEATEELENKIREMGNADANLTLFMLANNGIKPKENLIKVDDLLQRLLTEDMYQNIDIMKFQNSIDYSILLTEPFPFYYTNSLYATSMRTCMVFDRTNGFSFGVQNIPDINRQEVRLHQGENHSRISQYTPMVNVKEKKIELEYFGFIPATFMFPDIIIEDASKRVRYVLPVVFFKNFPRTGHCLLVLMSLILGYLFVLIIGTKKNNSKKTSIEKKEDNASADKDTIAYFK